MRNPVHDVILCLLLLWTATASADTGLLETHLRGTGWSAEPDSEVVYEANDIRMRMDDEVTLLSGNARVDFLDRHLTAEYIEIDWEQNTLHAWGRIDTVWTDSTQTVIDSTYQVGRPDFQDAATALTGFEMLYNFKSRRGRVIRGGTEFGDGVYRGGQIKKADSDELHIKDGIYTTCKEDPPHYHFYSPRMKLILKDKVIARPVWLYFGNVRTLGIPFAVFSIKTGRRSGLIMPAYSESSRRGHELKHLGYYWAASRYWDTWIKADYADNGPDWLFLGNLQYLVRDKLNGRFNTSYYLSGTSNRTAWDIDARHQQKITPYLNLNGNIRYASSQDYYQNASDNIDTRLTQSMTSNVTLSGSIPQWKDSWSLSGNLTRNMANGTGSGSLPSFSYRHGSRALLPMFEEGFLSGVNYSYSGRLQNPFSYDDEVDNSFDMKQRIYHDAGINGPLRLGYLALNPSLSLSERWAFSSSNLRKQGAVIDTTTHGGLARRLTFNFGTSLSTKIYGLVRTRLGSLRAIRHVITPTARLTYTPDFSKSWWGYFDELEDSLGNAIRLDRFAGSPIGSTPSRRSLQLSGSIGNVFQAKSVREDEEIKKDVLSVQSNFSYNFYAEQFPLSDITSRISSSPSDWPGMKHLPIRNWNLDLTTTHSLYHKDENNQVIDRYVWLDAPGQSPGFPNLEQYNLSSSFSFSGISNRAARGDTTDTVSSDPTLDRFDPGLEDVDMSIPWNGSVSLYYQENRSNPDNITHSSWLSLRLSFNFTRNWKVSWNGRVNLDNNQMISQQLSIYRDLHCWEARFSWQPSGPNPSYFLKISVKSPTLQDLKLEKRSGNSRAW